MFNCVYVECMTCDTQIRLADVETLIIYVSLCTYCRHTKEDRKEDRAGGKTKWADLLVQIWKTTKELVRRENTAKETIRDTVQSGYSAMMFQNG